MRYALVRLQAIGDDLDAAQGGFRKGKSTHDLILALDVIVKDRHRKREPSWQSFLDIRGAYDSANRDLLWKRCSKWESKGVF